ncbi:MAG: hypothetical protein ACRDTA_24330 [Pseudonocardiaceae bacterium]
MALELLRIVTGLWISAGLGEVCTARLAALPVASAGPLRFLSLANDLAGCRKSVRQL